MPNWENIEDVRSNPPKVWLTRVKEIDDWKPLRKCDCFALNNNENNDNVNKRSTITIEEGRATADKERGIVTANFHRAPDRSLCSAFWFVKKDSGSNENKSKNLEPVSNEVDTKKIETLYQMAVEASGSFGQGVETILKEEVELEDGSKVFLSLTGGGSTLSLKKKPPSWLSSSLDLQRGYGSYTVEGEDIELMLGPVRHLFFVVHGIGESIWTRDGSKIPSLLEEMNRIRVSVQKRQVEEWKRQCEKAKKESKPVPKMPSRIEFIPIEWYDQLHSSSSALTKTLNAVTLPAIPALRAIANEAVFDVMLYITPGFTYAILECVTDQINAMYQKFLEIHPKFLSDGGQCSLIGHSLGSVICWDLLSILKDYQDKSTDTDDEVADNENNVADNVGQRESTGGQAITSDNNNADVGFQAYAKENADTSLNGTWRPSLPKRMVNTIPFTPEFTIFLGSPIGLFLTLRGAHPVFNELREKSILEIAEKCEKSQTSITESASGESDGNDKKKDPMDTPEIPYASPFKLPSGAIYNVYSASDPVAYRIEPLLLPPEMNPDNFPPAVHLTVEGQSVRLHVKAQQFGDEIGKFFEGKKGGLGTFLTQAVSALGKAEDEASQRSIGPNITGPQTFALAGNAKRLDYQLQRGVVENEYLSAVTAHSNYFVNTDFQDFLMSLTSKYDVTREQSNGGDII